MSSLSFCNKNGLCTDFNLHLLKKRFVCQHGYQNVKLSLKLCERRISDVDLQNMNFIILPLKDKIKVKLEQYTLLNAGIILLCDVCRPPSINNIYCHIKL